MNSNLATATQAINMLAAATQLAAALGVNYQALSNAISQARAEGRDGLSAEELQQFVDEWRATDQAEIDAYNDRMDQ